MYRFFFFPFFMINFQLAASYFDISNSNLEHNSPVSHLSDQEIESYIQQGKDLLQRLMKKELIQNNMIDCLQEKDLKIYERSKTIEDSALRIIDIGRKCYKGVSNLYSWYKGESKITVLGTDMTPVQATELRKKMLQDVIVLIWALWDEQNLKEDPCFPFIPPLKLEGKKARRIVKFLNCYMLLASQKRTLEEIDGPVSLLENGTQVVYRCDWQTKLKDIEKLEEKFAFTTGKLNGCTGYKSSWENIEFVKTKMPGAVALSDLENTEFERGIDIIFASNEGTKTMLPAKGSALRYGMLKGENSSLFIQIEHFGLVGADSQIQYLTNKFRFTSLFDKYFYFCHQALREDKISSDFRVPFYFSGDKIPYQGWKIHIPLNARDALVGIKILNYLLKEKFFFRTISNEEVTQNIPLTDVRFGKEIEIYMETEDQYVKTVNCLDNLIKQIVKEAPSFYMFSSRNLFENPVGDSRYMTSTYAILNPEKAKAFINKDYVTVSPHINEKGKGIWKTSPSLPESFLFAVNEKGQLLKLNKKGREKFGLNGYDMISKVMVLAFPFSDYYPCRPYKRDPWIQFQNNKESFYRKDEDLRENNLDEYNKLQKFANMFKEMSSFLKPYVYLAN